jgi:DNA-binding NarL/FixJ family response regulator
MPNPVDHNTKLERLTRREREILNGVARGMSNKAIARELCVSDSTVEHHLTAIYAKLGCANRMQAALCLLDAGGGSE